MIIKFLTTVFIFSFSLFCVYRKGISDGLKIGKNEPIENSRMLSLPKKKKGKISAKTAEELKAKQEEEKSIDEFIKNGGII